MYQLIRSYARDLDTTYLRGRSGLRSLSSLSLPAFYNLVKNIPYKRDSKPIEVIARPKIILSKFMNGRDCKKAAILMGAWFHRRGVPYRLMTVSTRRDRAVHHVFPQVRSMNGDWLNVDATYPDQKLFERKRVTKAEILKR